MMHRSVAVALVFVLAGCSIEEGIAIIIGVDTIEAKRARDLLSRGEPPIVVDTRDEAAFKDGQIAGAVLLTKDQLDGYFATIRPSTNRPVIAVCYSGHASQVTAASARAHGYEQAYSLKGGMERWTALGYPVVRGPPSQRLDPAQLGPPVLRPSWFEQLVDTIAGLALKPFYMLLSLVIALWLRRQQARDLTLIRQGMIAFLVGESICTLNFLSAAGGSETLELLHGAGMVVMGALLPWGLFVLLDDRVLRVSDPGARCVFQRFCGHCWKREAVNCGLQRLFLFMAPALALMALMPFSTPLRPLNVIMQIFDANVVWEKGPAVLLVELRLYPTLAALHFLWTTWRLCGDKTSIERAQGPFFWGFGFASFALMRYFMFTAYRAMPPWADWWEEATEFIAVGGTAVLLWVFRRQLGLVQGGEPGVETPKERGDGAG